MKLFRTVRWCNSRGTINHYLCLDNEDELKMRKYLDNHTQGKVEITEIDIASIDNIMELVGLSLKDLKRLLNNI
jgi:hypothetical protein